MSYVNSCDATIQRSHRWGWNSMRIRLESCVMPSLDFSLSWLATIGLSLSCLRSLVEWDFGPFFRQFLMPRWTGYDGTMCDELTLEEAFLNAISKGKSNG